jgi:ABC-type phosphate transport system permease subunit
MPALEFFIVLSPGKWKQASAGALSLSQLTIPCIASITTHALHHECTRV